jgi:hypothetical protein
MAGFEALDLGSEREAAEHFRVAMTWPERLGLGRPYEPEERLQQYLLGLARESSGAEAEARVAWEAVVAATDASILQGDAEPTRMDLLAAAALSRLGRAGAVSSFAGGDGPTGSLVDAVAGAAREGRDVMAALRGAAQDAAEVFADPPGAMEGRLLYRALTLPR